MNKKKKTRLFGRILTTVALISLLSTTAFAGSPEAPFKFHFDWGSDTQYSEPAVKTDAGTTNGQYADVYSTQDTKITYTVVKKNALGKYVDYSKSGVLYSDKTQQIVKLKYTESVVNYTSFRLRADSAWGRYGDAKGVWYP